MTADRIERIRCVVLWLCLGIFLVRVIGQIEVVLLAPRWLPPFSAWESGLIPYWVLLPVQVILAAGLAAIASDHSRGAGPLWVRSPQAKQWLKAFATVYALIMLARLLITAALTTDSLIDRGLIPILAHWDLALFIYLLSRSPPAVRPTPQYRAARVGSNAPARGSAGF